MMRFALLRFQAASAHGGSTTLPVEVTGQDEQTIHVRQLDGRGPTSYRRDEVVVAATATTLTSLGVDPLTAVPRPDVAARDTEHGFLCAVPTGVLHAADDVEDDLGRTWHVTRVSPGQPGFEAVEIVERHRARPSWLRRTLI